MRLLYVDIDTLRADHLGCAGYHRDTTPNIDALAADGIRFTQVYASDVPCLPSRTALATGTFGIRNGVVNHGGAAADLRPQGAGRRFTSMFQDRAWATQFYRAGWHTASISSFPFRHSASWWNHGFMEAMNLMRGWGGERADEVLPGALDWLARNGADDDWFLHVHLWDPHTPWDAPADFGEPFAGDPIPAWYTEEVRARHWDAPGPALGPGADRLRARRVRLRRAASRARPWRSRTWRRSSTCSTATTPASATPTTPSAGSSTSSTGLGVLDDTAILVSSDHGEGFGELGVYADHQAADEATCHVPAVLRWPGLPAGEVDGLLYQLDVAATVVELAGIEVPDRPLGRPLRRRRAARRGADRARPPRRVAGRVERPALGALGRPPVLPHPPRRLPRLGRRDAVRPRRRPARAARPRRRTARRSSPRAGSLLASWTSDQLARSFSPRRPDGRGDGRGRPVPHPRPAAGLPRAAPGDRPGRLGRPPRRPPRPRPDPSATAARVPPPAPLGADTRVRRWVGAAGRRSPARRLPLPVA